MKAIIQNNFTSGLGDFISDFTQYHEAAENLKKQGYEIHLIYNLNGNKYVSEPFIRNIFSENDLSVFDSILEVENTHNVDYLGTKYHSSAHHPQYPGAHHWDIFFDVVPDNFNITIYDATKAHMNNYIPNFLPEFSKSINEGVENFKKILGEKYVFFHVRTSDIIDGNTDRYKLILQSILNFSNENPDTVIHLGTNNRYITNNISNTNKNIISYKFENFDKIDNDMNAFLFNGNVSKFYKNEVALKRVSEIIIEMVSVKNASEIYIYHDLSWVSNFLFYPICYNKNKIKIHNLIIHE